MHHLRSPCPGDGRCGGTGQTATVLCHTAPGHDWALGVTGHWDVTWSRAVPSKRFGKHDTMVPTRQRPASRAAPLSRPQPGHARGSRQSRHGQWGDWHSLGPVRQPFLFAPDVCQGLLGQAPGRGGPGRVSAGAWQPGSAAISVPHMGPWAGHSIAGQGSHMESECRGRPPASS